MASLPPNLYHEENWSIESFDIYWIQHNPLRHQNRIQAHASLGKELTLLSGALDQSVAEKARSLQKQLKNGLSEIVDIVWDRSEEIAKSQVQNPCQSDLYRKWWNALETGLACLCEASYARILIT